MARWLIFPLLMAELKSIINMMKDKKAPKRYKAVVILGLIYLFSPVDLIPAPVLGLSIIDDVAIWGAILAYIKEPLSAYKGDPISPKDRKYKGKKVVEVDDYVVMDEDKEMRKDDE